MPWGRSRISSRYSERRRAATPTIVVGTARRTWNELGKLGVRNIGLAPRGRAPWEVQGKVRDRLIRERALIEGSIGTIKCNKYGFNRPAARSAR